MHHMSVCGTTFADLLTRFVWGALERLWHLQLCRQMWKERIDAVSPSSQLLVNVYSKHRQPTWNQAHSVPLSFPGLSANAIRANMPTVSGVKNVNGPLSEMWSLSMESCDAFPKFSIPAGMDAENSPAPALSSRGSVIERTPGVLRYLSQRDLGCFNCKNSFVSMWVTRYTNVYSALSPASHRPRCFQGGNTHTEHREQGKQSLGKFQTLHSALSLLTDVALQFYLSSLKAFSLSESFSGTPFDSVGVLKLFSSALAALGGIHGYSIIFLLCHAMQPPNVSLPLADRQHCDSLKLSVHPVILCHFLLPVWQHPAYSIRIFHPCEEQSKGWGEWGKPGKEQGGAGGEMRWGRGKSRDNNGVGKQWKDPREEGND